MNVWAMNDHVMPCLPTGQQDNTVDNNNSNDEMSRVCVYGCASVSVCVFVSIHKWIHTAHSFIHACAHFIAAEQTLTPNGSC